MRIKLHFFVFYKIKRSDLIILHSLFNTVNNFEFLEFVSIINLGNTSQKRIMRCVIIIWNDLTRGSKTFSSLII